MSGPWCETCKYFVVSPFADASGECSDPTKAIYDSGGNRANSEPEVRTKFECHNWSPCNEVAAIINDELTKGED